MHAYSASCGVGEPFPAPEEMGRMLRQMKVAMASARAGRTGAGPAWSGPWSGGADFWWGGARRGGRGRGWPFDPGRGRAGRGDVRLAILALLRDEPKHGYQIIGDIRERSAGTWNPSPGSVYPALSALQDEGLIDDQKIDGKRVFSLTGAGREYVAERAEDLARVFPDTDSSQHEEAVDLRELIWGVGGAAVAVLSSGSPEQRDRAREILARTRRELYQILADDAGEQ